jgi:hypothetical protein
MSKTKKCDISRLQPGDKYSRLSYGEVVKVNPSLGWVCVRNEDGKEWHVAGDIFEDEFTTADQWEQEREVTRTEMVDVIISNPRIAMTVTFRKKPEPKVLRDTVQHLIDAAKAGDKTPTSRKLSAMLKEATEGETRVMVGRHFGVQDEFGRLSYTDMEAKDSRLRKVDPRTVEEAIIDNVKYVLK